MPVKKKAYQNKSKVNTELVEDFSNAYTNTPVVINFMRVMFCGNFLLNLQII
jgi:hypothetical protein